MLHFSNEAGVAAGWRVVLLLQRKICWGLKARMPHQTPSPMSPFSSSFRLTGFWPGLRYCFVRQQEKRQGKKADKNQKNKCSPLGKQACMRAWVTRRVQLAVLAVFLWRRRYACWGLSALVFSCRPHRWTLWLSVGKFHL